MFDSSRDAQEKTFSFSQARSNANWLARVIVSKAGRMVVLLMDKRSMLLVRPDKRHGWPGRFSVLAAMKRFGFCLVCASR